MDQDNAVITSSAEVLRTPDDDTPRDRSPRGAARLETEPHHGERTALPSQPTRSQAGSTRGPRRRIIPQLDIATQLLNDDARRRSLAIQQPALPLSIGVEATPPTDTPVNDGSIAAGSDALGLPVPDPALAAAAVEGFIPAALAPPPDGALALGLPLRPAPPGMEPMAADGFDHGVENMILDEDDDDAFLRDLEKEFHKKIPTEV